jgi:hypothetical protein
MKQINIFGEEEIGPPEEGKYTAKIEAPIYEPKNTKPHVLELYDRTKTARLITEIEQADIPEEEKAFLINASARHTVFHYERIADYYAHATPATQRMMERSALVIIDFDKAIQNGYVRLCDDIRAQYMQEYGEQ